MGQMRPSPPPHARPPPPRPSRLHVSCATPPAHFPPSTAHVPPPSPPPRLHASYATRPAHFPPPTQHSARKQTARVMCNTPGPLPPTQHSARTTPLPAGLAVTRSVLRPPAPSLVHARPSLWRTLPPVNARMTRSSRAPMTPYGIECANDSEIACGDDSATLNRYGYRPSCFG